LNTSDVEADFLRNVDCGARALQFIEHARRIGVEQTHALTHDVGTVFDIGPVSPHGSVGQQAVRIFFFGDQSHGAQAAQNPPRAPFAPTGVSGYGRGGLGGGQVGPQVGFLGDRVNLNQPKSAADAMNSGHVIVEGIPFFSGDRVERVPCHGRRPPAGYRSEGTVSVSSCFFPRGAVERNRVPSKRIELPYPPVRQGSTRKPILFFSLSRGGWAVVFKWRVVGGLL
jgi:hypothetical protein